MHNKHIKVNYKYIIVYISVIYKIHYISVILDEWLGPHRIIFGQDSLCLLNAAGLMFGPSLGLSCGLRLGAGLP